MTLGQIEGHFFIGIKTGCGVLEIYLGAKALDPFINKDLILERFVPFRLPEVEGLKTAVKGLPAELFIEVNAFILTPCSTQARSSARGLRISDPPHGRWRTIVGVPPALAGDLDRIVDEQLARSRH